jgi:hypothetical protein
MNPYGRRCRAQGLGIRIGGNEVNALKIIGYHGINGIAACSADTDYLDLGRILFHTIQFEHSPSLP